VKHVKILDLINHGQSPYPFLTGQTKQVNPTAKPKIVPDKSVKMSTVQSITIYLFI